MHLVKQMTACTDLQFANVCMLFITYTQSCFCQGSGENLLVLVYFVLVRSCFVIIQNICYWLIDQYSSWTKSCLRVIGWPTDNCVRLPLPSGGKSKTSLCKKIMSSMYWSPTEICNTCGHNLTNGNSTTVSLKKELKKPRHKVEIFLLYREKRNGVNKDVLHHKLAICY